MQKTADLLKKLMSAITIIILSCTYTNCAKETKQLFMQL